MSFKAKLEAAGIQSEMLDDLVHDAASRVASRVNDEGLKEQLIALQRLERSYGYDSANRGIG